MAIEKPTIDRQCGAVLADLIRENLDDLIEESEYRYSHDYAHSANNNLDVETKRAWSRQDILSMAEQLEDGRVDPHQYELLRGDIVLQNEELLYPIDAFLEETYYIARMIADLVWEKCLSDTRTMNALLATLEAFVQLRTIENMGAFCERIAQPRAIVRTWHLGKRWASRATGGTKGKAQQGEQAAGLAGEGTGTVQADPDRAGRGPLEQLTAREADIARLVAEGKSNNEVASSLGLQLSTVRNALSRVYVKMGISSRAELIVTLAGNGR